MHPRYNPLSDISLNAGAGAQMVGLSGITAGAFNETQTLTVLVDVEQSGLGPSSNGELLQPRKYGKHFIYPCCGSRGRNDHRDSLQTMAARLTAGRIRLSRLSTFRIGVPTISGFSPTSGAAGSLVTITGANFDPTPTLNRVYFGTTPALVISATPRNSLCSLLQARPTGLFSVTARKLTAFFQPAVHDHICEHPAIERGGIRPPPGNSQTAGEHGRPTVMADLNADGKPDVLAKGGSGFNYYQNNSSDYVLHPSMFSPGFTLSLVGADGGDVGESGRRREARCGRRIVYRHEFWGRIQPEHEQFCCHRNGPDSFNLRQRRRSLQLRGTR
jgi:hypothetical protein